MTDPIAIGQSHSAVASRDSSCIDVALLCSSQRRQTNADSRVGYRQVMRAFDDKEVLRDDEVDPVADIEAMPCLYCAVPLTVDTCDTRSTSRVPRNIV